MEDLKIIQLLKEGKRSKAFLKLYKGYPAVEKLIVSKGGSKEDAKDIFQEALIIFYEKVKRLDFQLTAQISTYVYSVCRFLWKDELKKRNKSGVVGFEIDLDKSVADDVTDFQDKEDKYQIVEEVLLQIGEKCLRLLELFYYQHLSMKSIADKLNFKSENVAKNQKYKCLERAKIKLSEIQSNLINS